MPDTIAVDAARKPQVTPAVPPARLPWSTRWGY